MADKKRFPEGQVPVRKTQELLPKIFRTFQNNKFMSAVVDPMVQPGVLNKLSGYIGRRYGKTYNGTDIYLDTDQTLRSRYQLEPGIVFKEGSEVKEFYDYLDLKNQLKFFSNFEDRDDLITEQDHYTWNPPIDWDKFVNYREYFWEPSGPPPVTITGNELAVISSYKVQLGDTDSFIFSNDFLINNPEIVLYRGKTYEFKINAPGEGFVIRTNYDTASLKFNPNFPYSSGQLVEFGGKIWKATKNLLADPFRTVSEETGDWVIVEEISNVVSSLDYNKGVTNNRIESGVLVFEVPFDAPDVLFYQGIVNPNRVGRFVIGNIQSNTTVDIEKEILSKATYTSGNGVNFTNGLVVDFIGKITPEIYSRDTWLVQGVGTKITLTNFKDLVVPPLRDQPALQVLFDDQGFDTQPFDDAIGYPGLKDYITVAQDSKDQNAWSRSNRWFHRSVLEYAYQLRGQIYSAPESARAKRPIIEFLSNLQLAFHATTSKKSVDFLDDFTDDVFSKIEGKISYNVDGEFLFDGARLLVVADTDALANNKIYQVKFITHLNRRQITLREVDDSDSVDNEGVLVKRGKVHGGKNYYFRYGLWLPSQLKTQVNQPPLFDVFDDQGASFTNSEFYPQTTFRGSQILSYKAGNGPVDPELRFNISYQNIENVGDIEFVWNWEQDSFNYSDNPVLTKKVSTGFFKFEHLSEPYANGWTKLDNKYSSLIVDSVVIQSTTDIVQLQTIDWDQDPQAEIYFYLNDTPLNVQYSRVLSFFRFASTFNKGDVITVKVKSILPPDQGYYQFPLSLEKNPLNRSLLTFTLGQAADHLRTAVEFDKNFQGTILKNSNLRDLDQAYRQNGKRFLKHAGTAPLAVALVCDKHDNLIKSLRYAKQGYTKFKSNFIEKAATLPFVDSIPDYVDAVLVELTKTKNTNSAFFDSDMLGFGAYTSIKYAVDDDGITTFALSEKFSLDILSRKAVYVYINAQQLLHDRDYEFNDTFGFVLIKKPLVIGDVIEIREYVSTADSYIPPTPTSMGLYKKYTPEIFLDDTYLEPRMVVQGHDGSITVAFNDYRDQLLLELEYRIYNNIKQEYDSNLFDIDSALGGYYGNALFGKQTVDTIIAEDFLKWVRATEVDYIRNQYFLVGESFTYTYSRMLDPTQTVQLPGWWRGVYQWVYDTDRPHRCPWEMLGFSEKPLWWEQEYGPAPYTKNNLVLWEDIRDGIIRHGPQAGRYSRYARPSILSHIPVNEHGQLLSPLESRFAQQLDFSTAQLPFTAGDVSPAEYAWRSSSEWPFAVMIALSLLKPFDFVIKMFNRSCVQFNRLGQVVNSVDNSCLTVDNLVSLDTVQPPGLNHYLVGYIKSTGRSVDQFETKITNLDVQLSSRLSGFVDKQRQKYLLDSKNPSAKRSGIFIPPENYDIIFNVSSPFKTFSYSGVVVEKTNGGWIVFGYDQINPYFSIFLAVKEQKDPVFSIGGVSANFLDWKPNVIFGNGKIVRYQNDFYRSIKTHDSGSQFELENWRKLPKLPVEGAVEAKIRRKFDKDNIQRVGYGTTISTVQDMVDFLLGYQEYLKSQGFSFTEFDRENQVPKDWLTAAKEFMFWTSHNWSGGSLISLSPASQKLTLKFPVGVADNLLASFYDYEILRADGNSLPASQIDIIRDFETLELVVTSTNTSGIYYANISYVIKENVVLFDDKTVFNDVIYDETSGYRQERIKNLGFRTTDWDGNYTAPGFLFDTAQVDDWQPFINYKLGDTVRYRSYFWAAQINHNGEEQFNEQQWVKLDSMPKKQLVPNFDYRANQIEEFYDVDSEGLGENQRLLARHSIGYQPREYLQDIAEDSATQFQLYRGFIRDKGTNSAITKVFDKLSRQVESSVDLKEEWAFRVGSFGGIDQVKEIEFEIDKIGFVYNPQLVLLKSGQQTSMSQDLYYRVFQNRFTLSTVPFTENVNPLTNDILINRVAGYVSSEHVDVELKNKDELLNFDINSLQENQHVWLTFEGISWTVLRYVAYPLVRILDAQVNDDTIILTVNNTNNFDSDGIIGITGIDKLTGFYKILSTSPTQIVIENKDDESTIDVANSLQTRVSGFVQARVSNYQQLDFAQAAMLPERAKLWIDNNLQNEWEVVEKTIKFSDKLIQLSDKVDNEQVGTTVAYNEKTRQVLVSVPNSKKVIAYTESADALLIKQILPTPTNLDASITENFGRSLAISNDGKWLAVGTPGASNAIIDYRGKFDSQQAIPYSSGSIVEYAGTLWKAQQLITFPTNTPNTDSRWSELDILEASFADDSTVSQYGIVSLYEYNFQQRKWFYAKSILSPRPAENELFGQNLKLLKNNNGYLLAVSAPGSNNNQGRVYLFSNQTGNTADWKHRVYQGFVGDAALIDPATPIVEGMMIWYDGSLWLAKDNGNESSSFDPSIDSNWEQLSPTATPVSLPQREQFDNNDQFGFALDIDPNGTTLAVSAPYSSNITSLKTGKVLVYTLDNKENYQILQSLEFDSTDQTVTGDLYGFAVKLSEDSQLLLVSNPKYDQQVQDQGSVLVFEKNNQTYQYQLKQTLKSFENFANEMFGQSICMDKDKSFIAIGAKNTPLDIFLITFIDNNSTTEFDDNNTQFIDNLGYSGAVYIFEKKNNQYFLTEKLKNNIEKNESFGFSIACGTDLVVVGSPFCQEQNEFCEIDETQNRSGKVRLFRRRPGASSWKTIAKQQDTVDIRLIKNIVLYDNVDNVKISDIDYIDSAKLKILNTADQEIKFKTIYDPAIYNFGTGNILVDIDQRWAEEHVGELWWDLSQAKWKYYEQGDQSYRYGNWNQLAAGASIDVYEWVETDLLPSEWVELADTNEGIAQGISGQPLYPNNLVFSQKQVINPFNGNLVRTLYYYWVKNSQIVPLGVVGRRISAAQVAQLIVNPAISGQPVIGIANQNQLIAYNFGQAIKNNTALLNVQYRKTLRDENNIHREYQLIAPEVADSVPNEQLERKWIDSLVGYNELGFRVPDDNLPEKLKYGVKFEPRQGMFIDRAAALKIAIEYINSVLQQEAFVDIINFSTLESKDQSPNPAFGLYDVAVDTKLDLDQVGTARVRPAQLSATINNGRIVSITIDNPGFGYRVAPPIVIQGTGTNAQATCEIDRDGRIKSVNILNPGKKYNSAQILVRSFSVLVSSDETLRGFWSIYSWDSGRKEFFRSRTQAFDTSRYWETADWWKKGYSPDSRIVKEIIFAADEAAIEVDIGDLIRVKEFANGGWAVFEKVVSTGQTFLQNYQLVGRQQGTIQLSQELYNRQISGVGYDFVQNFDTAPYDFSKSRELRNIFKATKEDIFQGKYRVEWNRLFFSSVRYIFVEQQYVDWAFKTSFLDAIYNIGPFKTPVNFKADNLESFKEYINEVKPYRTTVREYLSKYDNVEDTPITAIDFDLPPSFLASRGQVAVVQQQDPRLEQFPWKWWADNQGYAVTEVVISDSGTGYVQVPQVIIEGNGVGAVAQAFISNGKISGIKVLDPGKGYTQTPSVLIVGGNRPGDQSAQAVAILGDSLVRAVTVNLKFDRISKTGYSTDFVYHDQFVASGFTAAFDLTYVPVFDRTGIEITKNSVLMLNNEYTIQRNIQTINASSVPQARVIFTQKPQAGDVIDIKYTKDIIYLDSVNRIEQFYNPTSGMLGSNKKEDLNQLMTGIDFGGVSIQGLTFDITGGWDAAPWFTDTWDGVDGSGDFYFMINLLEIETDQRYSKGSLVEFDDIIYSLEKFDDGFVLPGGLGWEEYWKQLIDIELPFIPEKEQPITIYLKRNGKETRIDADDFIGNEDSTRFSPTNPNAVIDTFVGDGVGNSIRVDAIDFEGGDVIIFRTLDSDGTLKINDPNLLDTEIGGGNFQKINGGAYASAAGLTAEEIVILGGKFIEPANTPAPEENLPGHVLDNVSIKVFEKPSRGAAPLMVKKLIADGIVSIFDIGASVLDVKSALVYVNNVKQEYGAQAGNYDINFTTNQLKFVVPPAENAIIEIVLIGIGGVNLLDYQEIVADGATKLFLTNASFDKTSGVFVSVDGHEVDNPVFVNSEEFLDIKNKTLVQFAINVPRSQVVKIVTFGSPAGAVPGSLIRINQQEFVYDGINKQFELESFVELENASALGSLIVEINQQVISGPDIVYKIYDGINNQFLVGKDPEIFSTDTKIDNIKVYLNNRLLTVTKDYTFNSVAKTVRVFKKILSAGDVVKIVNDLISAYLIESNVLTIKDSVSILQNDLVKVTWFSNYDVMNVISDEYTGGQLQFRLKSEPLDISYVWAYKNGTRLIPNQDFYISKITQALYLVQPSVKEDTIKIVLFGSNVFAEPVGYEIHKDMFNRTHYKRFSLTDVVLEHPLYYYDDSIKVTDASSLPTANASLNRPGRVYINGERIEYFIKEGNSLKQLRRGVNGTAIAEVYPAGSFVIDVGANQALPYKETEEKYQIDSNGSSLLIELPFVPLRSTRTWPMNNATTIPNNFGPCDEIEVFVAGRRLRKDPFLLYNEHQASSSPAGDQYVDAEFSVDGISDQLRLTQAPQENVKIVVVRKIGKQWDSSIANFISEKSTKLFE